MKKRLSKLMILAMVMGLFSGCGNNSESSKTKSKYDGQELMVVDWGGSLSDAQKKAIYEPFEEKYGVTIVLTSPTEYGTITAMFESGKIDCDVVNVQPDYAMRMEKKGYLEKLDYNVIDKTDFDEDWYGDTWVASDLYGTAIVYNTDNFTDDFPSTWNDVWNVEKYPGKRTFWDYPTGMLEAALLADGVPSDEVYPIDVDRALDSLDKIKPSVVKWWDTGAESIQLVGDNEASVGALWGSRVAAAKEEGMPVEVDFNEAIIGADCWIVPKGAEHSELAMEFISYATSAEVLAEFMKLYPNGVVNNKAYDLLDKETYDSLATNPDKKKSQIMMDDSWWVENGDDAVAKFTAWLTE